ncbi:MAG TPA: hypothetical protein VLB09_04865, partial [Nitrospiria bacterium]|nr:hypothetical protein [Nitrospiria bacterium]
YTVTGLSASTAYCFAIRTSDEIPNESSDSNFADGTTSGADGVAPAQILDLTIITGGQRPDSIDLTWTAPSDNVRAVRYDIRYSLLPIGDPAGAGENDWSTLCTDVLTPTLNAKRPNDCVVPVVNLAPPIPAGFTEVRTIRGRINPSASPAFACDVADHDPSHEPCLVPNTTYYFAVKTEDSVPNSSTVSVSIGGDNPTDGSLGGRTALRKGFNLVAVPRALAGPDDTPVAVFDDDLGGTLNLQKWLSSGPSFTEGCYAASPSSGSDCVPQVDIPLVISGDGYFLSANGGNEVIDAPGTSASVTPGTNCGVGSSYQVAVSLGWNIVGDPFEKPVDLTNVMVCKGGSATAWNTAVGNGEVAAAMYSYDGSGYVAQTPTASPPALLGLFEPWKGYYIQVLDAAVTHLIFPQPP